MIRPVARGVVPTTTSFSERSDLLFTPAWLAGDTRVSNVDALRWFAADVLPLLLETEPDLRLRVTGADPPPAARAVSHPAVEFVGFVPNLGYVYAAARVVVVPMRFAAESECSGTGSTVYAVPVVATSVGAEGLAIADSRGVIVANDLAHVCWSGAPAVPRRAGVERATPSYRSRARSVADRPGTTWRQTSADSIEENRYDAHPPRQ